MMNNKKQKTVNMYVWPDGEYLHEGQIVNGDITTSLGYTKSDDYETIPLKHGMNHIDINGMILVVELDHWGHTWERELFRAEPPYEGENNE